MDEDAVRIRILLIYGWDLKRTNPRSLIEIPMKFVSAAITFFTFHKVA